MIALWVGGALAWAQVPAETRQLITGWSDGIDSSRAVLQRWERGGPTGWRAVGDPIPARLGRSGLAWGRGLHGDEHVPAKVEGDGRAPMGVFDLGRAFADAPVPGLRGGWPVAEVTLRDLWVEDPSHPAYNTHLRVDEGRSMSEWEVSQRMRLGDPAHRLKLVVAHNTVGPEPGRGSAIFLHIWRRDGGAPTAGCTSLPEASLTTLLHWLQPAERPVYALLTADGWAQYGAEWGLPAWRPSATTPVTEPP